MQQNFRFYWASFILAGCVLFGPIHVHAENYAFLVAIQDYDVKDLKKLNYTRSDIEEFSKMLQKSGFRPQNIVVMNDLPKKARYMAESGKIRSELDLLLGLVESGDTLVVAFSGHGVQFEGEEKNYYCPLDANLDDAKRSTLIPLSEIYDKLKQCPAGKKLLLVDACRNDPLSPIKKSRATVNLKSVTRPQTEPVPKGVVALFSCSAGQESYEWPDLKHGVFFHHVLEGWNGAAAEDGKQVTLDGLVSYSRKRTQEFTRENLKALQTPQLKSDFEGTWVLRKVDSGDEQEITNTIAMKLRLIPAGEFVMGSPNSETGRFDDEQQHTVRITKAFYLGKHEVTQGEWKAVMDTAPWRGKQYVQEGDDYPATYVSWEDAVDFCKRLSRKEGKAYRLPTEAEWEYACRDRKTARFHFGNDETDLGEYAWFDKNAWDAGDKYAHRVGLKKANPFGLHDMHGNVWEWCSDWYYKDYYASSPTIDPQGPETGSSRVNRGGGWSYRPAYCRSAYRHRGLPSYRDSRMGFRLALSSKE